MNNAFSSQVSAIAAEFAAGVVAILLGAKVTDLSELTLQVRGASAPTRHAAPAAKAAKAPASSRTTKPKTGQRAPAKAETARPAPAAKKTGRLARRTSAQIAADLDRVVALLKGHKAGLRAEQIRVELAMESKEMPRILKAGLDGKALKSKGQRRATTYTSA